MTQLLTLFITLSESNTHFKKLLSPNPPLIHHLPNKSTTIINKLSFLFRNNAASLLSILKHYEVKAQDCSCW